MEPEQTVEESSRCKFLSGKRSAWCRKHNKEPLSPVIRQNPDIWTLTTWNRPTRYFSGAPPDPRPSPFCSVASEKPTCMHRISTFLSLLISSRRFPGDLASCQRTRGERDRNMPSPELPSMGYTITWLCPSVRDQMDGLFGFSTSPTPHPWCSSFGVVWMLHRYSILL